MFFKPQRWATQCPSASRVAAQEPPATQHQYLPLLLERILETPNEESSRVLYQPAADLHQLQTRQRPVVDLRRQRHPPPADIFIAPNGQERVQRGRPYPFGQWAAEPNSVPTRAPRCDVDCDATKPL